MNNMTAYWIKTYHVDGFRFDCADNPYGPTRKIPAAFWKQLGKHLQKVKPDVLLLGECESPELALNPFQLDYGWHLYDALKSAFNGGDASKVMTTWNSDYAGDFPSGMLHMSMQDNWDKSRDIAAFGGLDAAKAAAVFNFTTNGVPLVYNGMEIGNGAGDVNPHDPIAWTTGDQSFTVFYRKLITLRLANPALQQGTMTWLQSTTPSQVLSYARQRDGKEFVILINTSSKPASGALNSMISGNWLDVAPNHENSSKTDNNPGSYILQPHQFAIYERLSKNTNQLH
jgi:glycosidase